MEAFSDMANANEVQSVNVSISTITNVKPNSTNTAIANETTYSFEIETASQTYVFGCTDSISRERWLTAIYASLTKHILSHSSYESRRRKDISVRSVIKFADAFKEQGAIYSSVATEAQRFSIDEHGINVNDIHEVSLYLQNEMLAAGLSSKLLQIFQEFLLIPFQTETAWNAIYNGVKIIRKHCHNKKALQGGEATAKLVKDAFIEDDNTKAEHSKSVVQMLKLKMEGAGSNYPEVSRLAMVTIAHEKEKTELLDRIRQLEEEYLTNNGEKKKFLSIAEANEHMKIMRMTQKIKDLEEFFASDQIRLQKQDNRIKELENVLEANRSHAEELRQVKQKLAECEKKLSETAQKEVYKPSSTPIAMNPFLAQLRKTQPVISDTHKETATATATAAIATAVVDTEAEEAFNKKFFKYKMMKKVLPEPAVRQKMSLDGFSEAEIEQFLSVAIASTASAPPAASLLPPPPPPTEPAAPDKFDKYRTMKKMFPLPILRHKMTSDGITADEIEGFLANIDGPPAMSSLYSRELASSSLSSISSDGLSSSSGHTSTSGTSSVNSGFSFPNANQTSTSTHSHLKQSIGKVARNLSKSILDLSSSVSAAVSKAPTPAVTTDIDAPPEGMPEKVMNVKPSVKLKGLFWSKLKPAELKNTVFIHLNDFQIPESVCKDIDDLFAAKVLTSVSSKLHMDCTKAPSSNKDANPNAAEDAKPAQVVSVLDGKRIQNVLIVMGKLRLGAEDIMNMIIDLDPRVLTAEVTASIISILPLTEEVNALKSHR